MNFKLADIIPESISNYYRYNGSLTTPPCNEIVMWNVVDPEFSINLSEDQLLEFQTLRDKNDIEVILFHSYDLEMYLNLFVFKLLTNSRPSQRINGRTIKRSFKDSASQAAASAAVSIFQIKYEFYALIFLVGSYLEFV